MFVEISKIFDNNMPPWSDGFGMEWVCAFSNDIIVGRLISFQNARMHLLDPSGAKHEVNR
jgi:hypothetical protein